MNLKIRIIWKICMNLKHGIDIIYSLKHHKDFRSIDKNSNVLEQV